VVLGLGMPTIDSKTARNIAAGLLMGFGWTAGMCFFGLLLYWARISPTLPEPQLGLVYPHNEHGSITYFSAFQATSCFLLFSISPLLFLIGFSIAPKKNIKTRVGKLSWSMKFDPDDPRKVLGWSQLGGAILAPLVIFTVGPSFVHLVNRMGTVLNIG
jgi:hypothetical protein